MTPIEMIQPDFCDVSELVAQIDAQPELWNQHKQRTAAPGTPHSDVDDIWLRYNPFENFKASDPSSFNEEHDPVWYPAWKALPALEPIVFDVMHLARGERLGGVLITRIPAGKSVRPHSDHGWHAGYYEKFAVQVKGDLKQAFQFDGVLLQPLPGDLYWFDNSKTHWVTNHSENERITLIICIRRTPCHGPRPAL